LNFCSSMIYFSILSLFFSFFLISNFCCFSLILYLSLPPSLTFKLSLSHVYYTPSLTHPLSYTLSITPSLSHPLSHTLSITPSLPHPLDRISSLSHPLSHIFISFELSHIQISHISHNLLSLNWAILSVKISSQFRKRQYFCTAQMFSFNFCC